MKNCFSLREGSSSRGILVIGVKCAQESNKTDVRIAFEIPHVYAKAVSHDRFSTMQSARATSLHIVKLNLQRIFQEHYNSYDNW